MKKTNAILSLIMVLGCQLALASPAISGDWCQNKYDDFNAVMTILGNGDVRRAMVGVEAGESGYFESGFISVGASNVTMELSGQAISIYDIKVKKHWLTAQETLNIKYNDQEDEIFNRCQLTWSKL